MLHMHALVQEIPYVMMHEGKNHSGNNRFYGFCVDILERISKKAGFNYLINVSRDKKYGAKDPETGEWNGMVYQLIKHVCVQKLQRLSIFLAC